MSGMRKDGLISAVQDQAYVAAILAEGAFGPLSQPASQPRWSR